MNDKLKTVRNVLAFIGFFTIGNAMLVDQFMKDGPEGIIDDDEDEDEE